MSIQSSAVNVERKSRGAVARGGVTELREASEVEHPVSPDQQVLFPEKAAPRVSRPQTALGPPSMQALRPPQGGGALVGRTPIVPVAADDVVYTMEAPVTMGPSVPERTMAMFASPEPVKPAPLRPPVEDRPPTGASPGTPVYEAPVEPEPPYERMDQPPAQTPAQVERTETEAAERIAQFEDGPAFDINHPLASVVAAVGSVRQRVSDFREKLRKAGAEPMTDVRAPASRRRQRDEVEAKVKILDAGSAVSAPLTGDSSVHITEVSISAELLWRAWMLETSYLRQLFAQDQSIDQSQMLDQDYGMKAITRHLKENKVYGLAEKAPAVNEQSAHVRRVRAHIGPDVKIHPVANVIWNADFDGDTMKVSFLPDVVRRGKRAANWLVSTAGESLIDVDFFNLAVWDQASVVEFLESMFTGQTFGGLFPDGFEFTPGELAGLADAIEKAGKGDATAFRSMLRVTKAIADRTTNSDDDAEIVVSTFLEQIYALNREIVMKRLEFEGYWDFIGLPSILDEAFESRTVDGGVPFPGLVSDPSLPSSLTDLSVSSGGPFGVVEGKNPIFRWAAGMLKMAREMAELFGEDDTARISEHLVAAQVSGLSELDEKNIAVAKAARKLVFEALGVPSFDKETSPEKWLTDVFAREWNKAAFIVRCAAVSLGLDMTLKPGLDLWMPFIEKMPEGDSEEAVNKRKAVLKAIRGQFAQVYGHINMGRLFGDAAPEGWALLPLSEFTHRNRFKRDMKFDEETRFDTVERFIGRLADIKTGFARSFHDSIAGDPSKKQAAGVLSKFFDEKGRNILADLVERRATEGIVLDLDIAALTQAFYALGEDAFYYFGLDSPELFLSSGIGQTFAAAKNEQELGSALITLMSMYRFSVIFEIEAKAKAERDTAKKVRLLDQRDYELEKLSSSSDLWYVLVKAYRGGAMDIFEPLLFSDTLSMDKKLQYLAQLVRAEFDGQYREWEVFSELYAAPRDTFSGNRFLSDMGRKSLKSFVKAANSKLDAYARENHDIYREQVATAREVHEPEGNLKRFFDRLRTEPNALVEVPLWAIADAALGVLIKSYDSGEKARQEDATNYLFSLVSEVANGDLVPDITYAGDVALGGVSALQFHRSPIWIIKALSDPDFEVLVYSGKGAVLVSMEKLLGTRTPSEQDYWDFFERHPRVAMSFKMRARQNEVDSKDSSYLITTESLSASISRVLNSIDSDNERIIRRLVDHPGFHALLPLTVEMHGMTVLQLRRPLTENITKVIDLLRSIGGYADKRDFVRRMYETTPMTYYGESFTWEELMELHKTGGYAEATGVGLDTATSEDVRDSFGFQLAQVLIELANGLDKYSDIVLKMDGIGPLPEITPEEAAGLFALHDVATIRTQQDVIQTHSAAKTALSTALQGGRTRALWALQLLNYLRPPRCDAPLETAIVVPSQDFVEQWESYEGLNAYFPAVDGASEEWMPVRETDIDEIVRKSPGQVLIEDPSACTSPTCACPRHATHDKSTNTTTRNTPAIGRLLLIVRMMSSEALNLKVKTVGRDEKDSIVKMRVMPALRHMQRELEEIYLAEGMQAARIRLAERLQEAFKEVGYKEEFSIHDFVNVAQLLIRVAPEDRVESLGQGAITVLQLGRLNEILINELVKARNLGKLDHEDAVRIARSALDSDPVWTELDIETLLSGVRAHSQSKNFDPRIPYHRSTSIGRSAALLREIVEENNVQVVTEKEADDREAGLRAYNSKVFDRWASIAGALPKTDRGRQSYRIIGIVDKDGRNASYGQKGEPGRLPAPGPANAWVLDARAPNARHIITRAYRLGINLLIEGEIPREQWPKAIPELGRWQYVQPEGLADGQYIMPMFEIRLNGGNTTWRGGTHDAGEFHAPPEKVSLIAETVGFDLGEALFQPTRSFAKQITFRRRGEYTLSLKQAFGQVVRAAENDPALAAKLDGAQVTIARPDDIRAIIEMSRQFDENGRTPLDDRLDPGVTMEPGSPAADEFWRAWDRYLGRLGDVNDDTGLIHSAMPGEIVGFLKMVHPDGEYYHPIRIFERFNDSGAPARVEIINDPDERPVFDLESSTLILPWHFKGDMEGRTFKIFEWLAASNKMMARAETVPDITLKNGMKLAGYIARKSTAGRRLIMRRSQKMMTLMFLARMEPFGYNLAEHPDALPDEPELKELMMTADATIHHWMRAYEKTDDAGITFFGDTHNTKNKNLNAFCNRIARRAIEYGINPTNVFASRFELEGMGKVPSNIWFNFQVLWGDMKDETMQDNLMSLFHEMMPRFCPDGVRGEQRNTLFNHDMQLLIPLEYDDAKGRKKTGQQWVDVYAGFHFFDEHFTGYSGSGTTVSPYSMSTKSTLMGAGEEELRSFEIDDLMGWAQNMPIGVPTFVYDDYSDGRD